MTLHESASVSEMAEMFTAWSAMSAGGPRQIDVRQVQRWYERRHANNFPLPLKGTERRGPYRPCKVWDITAALEWFLDYVPSKGGAPKGNRNHGKYAAERTRTVAKT